MTATGSGRAVAFLKWAALLAGMLAIIAGILGMHIMTGSPGMPASAAGHGAAMPQVMQPSAEVKPAPGPAAVQGIPGAASLSGRSCADKGGCATMSAMDAVCIPSPGNASLAAPLPGTTPLPADDATRSSSGFTTYAYLPGSPSPGQLCISRT
ncbi:DUF6153 family protein [Pseudarthrobacter sp. H2]|uniref:DUF6153 family protein n=1 Tax=Pseudarthrobacter sp. H2 TaxID=3418415 RepID=UPI003CF5291C